MIPNIFVSSTIRDLHHLRDAIRDTITELSYNPVMSDHGDIGYIPTESVEDSCYLAMKDSHLAIIIIGKRYGSIGDNNLSVTQNEFRTARNNNIPVICLIDKDVMTFKRIYDANSSEELIADYPGMDKPKKTFEFINEYTNYPKNNGFLKYTNVSDAREHLKKQLAHLFGELLRNKYDSTRAEIKDVLSEIKTLRHEMLKESEEETDEKYELHLKVMRMLLEDQNQEYMQFLKKFNKKLDEAISLLIRTDEFEEFVEESGGRIEIKKPKDIKDLISKFEEQGELIYSSIFSNQQFANHIKYVLDKANGIYTAKDKSHSDESNLQKVLSKFYHSLNNEDDPLLFYAIKNDRTIIATRLTKAYFSWKHEQLKRNLNN